MNYKNVKYYIGIIALLIGVSFINTAKADTQIYSSSSYSYSWNVSFDSVHTVNLGFINPVSGNMNTSFILNSSGNLGNGHTNCIYFVGISVYSDSGYTNLIWGSGTPDTHIGGDNPSTVSSTYYYGTPSPLGYYKLFYQGACNTTGVSGSVSGITINQSIVSNTAGIFFLTPIDNSTTTIFTSYHIYSQGMTNAFAFGKYYIITSNNSSTLDNNAPINCGQSSSCNNVFSTNVNAIGNLDPTVFNSYFPNYFATLGIATGTYYARAYYFASSTSYFSTYPVIGDLQATSNIITFTIVTGDVNNNTPSQFNGQPFYSNLVNNSSTQCNSFTIGLFSSTSIQAIGCYVTNWINNQILDVQVALGNFAVKEDQAFSYIFPFSIINNVNNDITTAQVYVNNNGAPNLNLTAIAINDAQTGLPTGQYTFGGLTMPVLNASTTSWIKDKAGFDYKAIIDYILYGITGLIMLGGAIGFIVMIRQTTTNTN